MDASALTGKSDRLPEVYFNCPMSILQDCFGLHANLARRHSTQFDEIAGYWASFSQSRREQCVKDLSPNGNCLLHPDDPSMGDIYLLIPEMNLRDLAAKPDHLLDLIRHRATTSLYQQFCRGQDGKLGDRDFIMYMMRTNRLRPRPTPRTAYTVFKEDSYGEDKHLAANEADLNGPAKALVDAGFCLPLGIGELIVKRQLFTMSVLNLAIDCILCVGPTAKEVHGPDGPLADSKTDSAASAVISLYAIQERPNIRSSMLALPRALSDAREHRDSLMQYLELLSSEPAVLAHAVNVFFFSHLELVADQHGRLLPARTEFHISSAIVRVVHGAVKAVAVWDCLCRLIELLEQGPITDVVYQATILQAISHTCHLEYSRTQNLLKEHLQADSARRYLKHITAADVPSQTGGAEAVDVQIEIDPDTFTRSDPRLRFASRLCQPRAQADLAAEWVETLVDLQSGFPTVRNDAEELEVRALEKMIATVGFLRDLSPAISIPPISSTPGLRFASRLRELEAGLDAVRFKSDLSRFAMPVNKLLEPGMAEAALRELDRLIVRETGANIGSLYLDAIEKSLSDVQEHCQQVKAGHGRSVSLASASYRMMTPKSIDGNSEASFEERKRIKTAQSPQTPGSESSVTSEIGSRASAGRDPVYMLFPSTPGTPPPRKRKHESLSEGNISF